MVFSNLSQTMQDLIMVNFNFFAKLFIIGFAFIASLIYVFVVSKNQEKTPFLFTALIRAVLYVISYVGLWLSPFTIFFMFPQVELDVVLQLMIQFYIIAFIVFGIVFLFNIMYFAPLILLKFGGLDIQSEKTNAFMKKVFFNLFTGEEIKPNRLSVGILNLKDYLGKNGKKN